MCHNRKSKSVDLLKSVLDLLSAANVTVSPWSIKATGIAAVLIALAVLQAGPSFVRETCIQMASYISSLWRGPS
jgi:hypothetical protein